MTKSLYKTLIFLPIIALCSCGYKVKEVFDSNSYNDPIFVNNIYNVYSEGIEPGSSNVHALEEYVLNDSKDYVFTSFTDDNFHFLEKDYEKFEYDDEGFVSDGKTAYGSAKKLSLYDETFKQGYVSKLFDGAMFCDGNTQKARVQIDESGFGSLFQKEIASYSYFAINFKASYDYTNNEHVLVSSACKSAITLKIGFYFKNSDGSYNLQTVKYHFDDIPTNSGGGASQSNYKFFGFKLGDNINISRCCGISVSYDIEDGSVAKFEGDTTLYTAQQAKEMGVSHSLMLYEVLLPDSTWH